MMHKLASKSLCKYAGCPRRNVPDFGRVFLMLKYTDITQNTYVQSWTVTEIMVRENCGLLAGPHTVTVSWQSYPFPSLTVVSYDGNSAHASHRICSAYGFVPLDKSSSRTLKRHFIQWWGVFTRDGVNNLRNVHTWSHDNPHETSVSNFQRRFTLNVWCGVLGNKLMDLLSLTTI